MEALEKPKERRMKSGGRHGNKGSPGKVDNLAAHQQVKLRIKLPGSPTKSSNGPLNGAKPSSSTPVATNQEPAVSDFSDHKSSDTEPLSPATEYQNFSNTSLKELRVTLPSILL